MSIDFSIFEEFHSNGISAIPILWDVNTKQAAAHPEHDVNIRSIDLTYVAGLLRNGFSKANGVAIKMNAPLCMLDFDTKNSTNQDIYIQWLEIVNSTNEDILRKVCIETTRSGGYHVYFKYAKAQNKVAIARNEGREVISLYTGGLLSYTYPTPGYQIIYNDFSDVDFLTDEEYELVVSAAAFFNQDEGFKPGDKIETIIDYPVEYESICLEFDQYLSEKRFAELIESIDLVPVTGEGLRHFKRSKFAPYLRKGSTGTYSAKVYFHSKRVLVFSASMSKFPTWHDAEKQGDKKWILTPARIIYYKNDKDWIKTISEIKAWSELDELNINFGKPLEPKNVVENDRLKFPYDIFPDSFQNFILNQRIQHEYLAGFAIAALSAAIGNSAYLEAMDGYIVRPVVFMAVVAPPGASKTPALKKIFAPLEKADTDSYKRFELKMLQYKKDVAAAKRDKTEEPEQPEFEQVLIKDSTIEKVIEILSHNKTGCCVVADELSGFMKRMNQYKSGDEVQKWLEIYSYAPTMTQRVGRSLNRVDSPFCSVVGGIQPGVMESLSKGDNAHNGFFHRFLFVFPEVQDKLGWQRLLLPHSIKQDYWDAFNDIYYQKYGEEKRYVLSDDANVLYEKWFDAKNLKYNRSQSDDVKGIISKYQDYCLRFALMLQVLHDGRQRTMLVQAANMERAIRLTEFFFGNMHKATRILTPETPLDNLKKQQRTVYDALPQMFGIQNGIVIAEAHKMKAATFKTFIRREGKELFQQGQRGYYEKIY